MVTNEKLKALREQEKMSQRDIDKRTGLARVHISRVENAHTVPWWSFRSPIRYFDIPSSP
jgi:transcriptional regulator with XRE-family HTH domain